MNNKFVYNNTFNLQLQQQSYTNNFANQNSNQMSIQQPKIPGAVSMGIENSQQLVKCYNCLTMILCNDTQSIATGEQNLNKISNENPQFLRVLLSIPLIEGISTEISKLAVVYSKNYVNRLLTAPLYNSKQIMYTMEIINEYLKLNHVQMWLKDHLLSTLTVLLQKQRSKTVLASCQQQLNILLQQFLQQPKSPQINYQYICILSCAIIESIPINGMVNYLQFMEVSFSRLVKLVHQYSMEVRTLAKECNKINQKDMQDIEQGSETYAGQQKMGDGDAKLLDKLSQASQTLLKFLQTLYKYIKRLKSIQINLKHNLDNPDTLALLQSILLQPYPFPNSQPQSSHFYIRPQNSTASGHTPLIVLTYKIKTMGVKILHECTKVGIAPSKVEEWERLIEINYGDVEREDMMDMREGKPNKKLPKGKDFILNSSQVFIRMLVSQLNNFITTVMHPLPKKAQSLSPPPKKHWLAQQLSQQEVQQISQLYLYLQTIITSNKFYKLVFQLKSIIIFGLLFKTIAFGPKDYLSFREQPEEFVNMVYEVVGYEQGVDGSDAKERLNLLSKDKSENVVNKSENVVEYIPSQQQSDLMQIQQTRLQSQIHSLQAQQLQSQAYPSQLRSLSSNLLLQLLSHMDGSLLELVMLCLTVLDSKTVQSVYTKDLILLMLGIVRKLVRGHEGLRYTVAEVLVVLIRLRDVPIYIPSNNAISTPLDPSLQYSLLLLTLDLYLPIVQDYLIPHLHQTLYIITKQIITNKDAQPATKYIALNVMVNILRNGDGYCDKIGWMILSYLDSKELKKVGYSGIELQGVLECLRVLIKEKGLDLVQNINMVKQIIQTITSLLKYHLTNLSQTPHKIHSLWHILQQLSTNNHLINLISSYIYESFNQLNKYINTKNQLILQEKIYKICVNMVKRFKKISQVEIEIISIIRWKFFGGDDRTQNLLTYVANTSTNKYSLALPFQLLQQILYCGRQSLPSASISTLLQLALTCLKTQQNPKRTQSQCCQGLLLFQSLVIGYHTHFNTEMWRQSLQTLWNKIKFGEVTYDFMKAELIVGVALVLLYGGACLTSIGNGDQIEQLVQCFAEILGAGDCFTYSNTAKAFILVLSLLLSKFELKFVIGNYSKLLQTVISLLQISLSQKDRIFQSQAYDAQQQQYKLLKSQTVNDFSSQKLDQFQFFTNQVQKIKQSKQFGPIFKNAYQRLSQNKKSFLAQISRVRKIGGAARVIYRFKGKYNDKTV